MIELKNWVAPKATPLIFVSLALLLAAALHAQAAVVKDLRIGNNDGYVRMVLEFDRPLTAPPSISTNHNHLQVSLTDIVNTLSTPRIEENQGDILRLNVSKPSDEIRIDAVFTFTPADIKTFALTDPHRFILDVYRPLPLEAASQTVENSHQMASDIASQTTQGTYRVPEETTVAGISSKIVEASMDGSRAFAAKGLEVENTDQNGVQQRLIAALIIVTTAIIVLLFFLIRISGRNVSSRRWSWRSHLPPTTDQNIESIDSVIRKHLKTYDHI